jgi:phosphoenolpyruvate carboxykinase (ATP)
VLDCYAGADPTYRLPVRIISEYAWHNLFCRNLFIDDPAAARASRNSPSSINRVKADPKRHGTNKW